ncbi:hypothetical protein Ddc_24866 [Ditylenchus destructor]|nr:hypothetical protein Ddc_24866 [Ditylenchus destructor]
MRLEIFNKELSPEEYDEWVIRNNYSKQISLKRQIALRYQEYILRAYGNYEGPYRGKTSVFFALVKELNHESWPVFQHFVRLLTDPFIYIRWMELIPQMDVFDLLTSTIDRSNRGRLQCEKLTFYFAGRNYFQKFFNWIKDHVRCDKFNTGFSNCKMQNCDKPLVDFFATGSRCASEIKVWQCNLQKDVFIDFVQVFCSRHHQNKIERPKAASLTDKARQHQKNKPRTTLTPEQPLQGAVVRRVAPDLLPWNVRKQSAQFMDTRLRLLTHALGRSLTDKARHHHKVRHHQKNRLNRSVRHLFCLSAGTLLSHYHSYVRLQRCESSGHSFARAAFDVQFGKAFKGWQLQHFSEHKGQDFRVCLSLSGELFLTIQTNYRGVR